MGQIGLAVLNLIGTNKRTPRHEEGGGPLSPKYDTAVHDVTYLYNINPFAYTYIFVCLYIYILDIASQTTGKN